MVRQKTRVLVLLFAFAAGITSSPDLVAHDDVALCEPCERSGWNIDFELGILQWYVTRDPGAEEQENRSGTGTYYRQPDAQYAAAPRIALSYLDSSGVGLRGTYFSFDSESDTLVSATNDETMQFKVGLWSSDYEMLFAKIGPRCSSMFSAGVRVMSFDFEEIQGEAGGSIIESQRESTFTGYGPTAAFELRRPGGVLTPFMKLRASVLYGDVEREDLPAPRGPGDTEGHGNCGHDEGASPGDQIAQEDRPSRYATKGLNEEKQGKRREQQRHDEEESPEEVSQDDLQ